MRKRTRKRRRATVTRARRPGPAAPPAAEPPAALAELVEERVERPETSPVLTGGDVDADWARAHLGGEEAVGGSVATPDQDVVDEIGEALGVAQPPDAEVRTSGEILAERDRRRWDLEREAAGTERGRRRPRRR